MVGNAGIVAITLIPLLSFSNPAGAQYRFVVEDLLNDLHVVETVDRPANERVAVRGTIPSYGQGVLTVQADCSVTGSYVVIRDDERSTQDLYPFERAACIAFLERLRAVSPGRKNQ